MAVVAFHAVDAQPKQQQVTLSFRTPSWFGFALECGECLTMPAKPSALSLPVIARIFPLGPAERASLQVGDTIVAVDGQELSAAELRTKLGTSPPFTTLRLLVGNKRGRSNVNITSDHAKLQFYKGDSLPVRYRGEFAQVTVDVMSMAAPVVTRDSSGAMLIHVGEHVIRLQRAP
jgi:C-terminal processing protease CtpA/Prc